MGTLPYALLRVHPDDLLMAEEYLEERGYVAPADIRLTRGT